MRILDTYDDEPWGDFEPLGDFESWGDFDDAQDDAHEDDEDDEGDDEGDHDPEADADYLLAQQELEDFEQADEYFGDAASDMF